MRIESISLTGDREENQDFCLYWEYPGVTMVIVADGLGGHQGGALAARFFCEGLRAVSTPEQVANLLAADGEDLAACCAAWLDLAAEYMRTEVRATAPGAEPLTTCAIVLAGKAALVVAHIGDSRVYRFDEQRLLWRTRDHSVVQMLLDEGEIEESAMGTHPDQGKLFRAIGMGGELKPTVRREPPLVVGEAMLACSDGFWERLQPEEFVALARGDTALEDLAELAVRRAWGTSDNVTAVLLRATRHRGWTERLGSWLFDEPVK